MVEFESLSDLKKSFQDKSFTLDEVIGKKDQITLEGIKFHSFDSFMPTFESAIQEGRKLFSVLTQVSLEENANTSDLQQLENKLLFSWKYQDGSFIPHDVIAIEKSLVDQIAMREGMSEKSVIGSIVNVTFTHPDLGTIEGKVDTGADACSLHADNIQVNGSTVSFERNQTTYKLNVAETVDIQSADGGTEARPVIKCTVSVEGNDQPHELLININDRTEMPNELLIGKELLNKLNVLIDPLKEFQKLDNNTQYTILNEIYEQYESNTNQESISSP